MTLFVNQPFVEQSTLPLYRALDPQIATEYGALVRAVSMSNADYALRYRRQSATRKMMDAPRHGRVFARVYQILTWRDTDGALELIDSSGE